ncbi:MAG: type II toxin-antitoxin system antitoxin SocA domain-containing protein [Pseudomonadota bacterium]
MAYDARAVSNLILDEAGRSRITHVALQKLLYFSHGLHLQRTGEPLVKGYFEAWQHGPVHPAVYQAFKAAGAQPIVFRAQARDPLTGEERALEPDIDDLAFHCVRRTVASYADLNPWALVAISHAKGAPWDIVVEQAKDGVAFGLRISDDLIRVGFGKHKVSIRDIQDKGDLHEEAPIDLSNRSGTHSTTG